MIAFVLLAEMETMVKSPAKLDLSEPKPVPSPTCLCRVVDQPPLALVMAATLPCEIVEGGPAIAFVILGIDTNDQRSTAAV
jgi:hypothetical protein